VLGAGAIMAAGNEEQQKKYLSGIAGGKSIVTLAIAEQAAKYTADAIRMKAARQGGDWVLNGTKLFVPDAQVADYIVTAAKTDNGITLFIVDIKTPGINVKPLKTVAGDKQCEVTFTNVKVQGENMLGDVDQGWQHIERILERANVALCAEMVGMAEQALKLTLDYAKERKAFGHPIGAFQSIQHRCADMLMDVEGSKYVTYQAAWRINEGLQATREAAIAKAWVGWACHRVMASAHQIHGAIGFSEDHILHFYTKKASANAFSYGDVNEQLEKIV